MVLETVQSLKNRIITGDTIEFMRAVSELANIALFST